MADVPRLGSAIAAFSNANSNSRPAEGSADGKSTFHRAPKICLCHTGELDTPHIPISSITARWNSTDQAVDLVIDGQAVIDIVDPQKQWGVSPFARRFRRGVARGWLAEYRGVFGDRDERLAGEELEIAVCGACGDLGCGNLAVIVEMTADRVNWRQPHWAGDVDEDDEADAHDPGSLLPKITIFIRTEYDAALADTARFIARRGWYRETPEAAAWPDWLRNRFTRSWDK